MVLGSTSEGGSSDGSDTDTPGRQGGQGATSSPSSSAPAPAAASPLPPPPPPPTSPATATPAAAAPVPAGVDAGRSDEKKRADANHHRGSICEQGAGAGHTSWQEQYGQMQLQLLTHPHFLANAANHMHKINSLLLPRGWGEAALRALFAPFFMLTKVRRLPDCVFWFTFIFLVKYFWCLICTGGG